MPQKYKKCIHCHGSGFQTAAFSRRGLGRRCPYCKGKGRIAVSTPNFPKDSIMYMHLDENDLE